MLGFERTSGCHGLVFEVVEPFLSFHVRLHPNTSLRGSDCRLRQAFRPRPLQTRALAKRALSILLRPSRRHVAVSISLTPGSGPSPSGTSDWPRVARASSSRGEQGPMQPSLLLIIVFQGLPLSPFRLHPRLGPHSLAKPPGAEARVKGEGAAPFCRARAEVFPVYCDGDTTLAAGGPPIMYGSSYLTMCQMIVARRRITATRPIFDPRRFLIL